MTDANRWKATVYVGGLAPAVTGTHVLDAFLPFGEIVEVQLPKEGEGHKGFAYVEYEEGGDAREAIENMDQAEFFGRVIKCSMARAPKGDDGLGSRRAVWEQESWLAEHAAEEQDVKETVQETLDPMQGLEGLDVAGPKPE